MKRQRKQAGWIIRYSKNMEIKDDEQRPETLKELKKKKKSGAVKSTIGNFATSVVLFPLGLLMGVFLARVLGPEGRGVYAYVTILGESMFPLILMGSSTGVFYYISAEKYDAKDVTFSALLIGAVNGALFALLLYFLWQMEWLGETAKKIDNIQVILPILITMPLTGVFMMSKQIFQGTSRFNTLNMIMIARFLFKFILIFSFVVIASWSVKGAIWAMAGEDILTACIVFYFFRKDIKPRFTIRKRFIKDSYAFGAKSWLSTLGDRSNDQLDQLILGYVAEPSLLGYYTISYSVLRLMGYLPNAISPVLFKLIAKTDDIRKSAVLATQVHRILFMLVGTLAITIFLSASWLIPFLYGEKFRQSVLPLLILLPGALSFWVTRRVINKFQTANNMPWQSSVVQIVGALTGLICYLILIPRWGIIGAASGSTIAYFASTICAIWYFYKIAGREALHLFTFSKADISWAADKLSSGIPFLKKIIK